MLGVVHQEVYFTDEVGKDAVGGHEIRVGQMVRSLQTASGLFLRTGWSGRHVLLRLVRDSRLNIGLENVT